MKWALALAVLAAAGCVGGAPHAPRAEDPQFLRSLSETATVAAVARRGVSVCREMTVGIAERDWLQGVVMDVEGTRVTVRIDYPGRFEHSVGGVKAARGASVRDEAIAWTPCR